MRALERGIGYYIMPIYSLLKAHGLVSQPLSICLSYLINVNMRLVDQWLELMTTSLWPGAALEHSL